MPKWTDYTIKTEPADKDEVMILDTSGKANKRLGLSALSDWIIGKIANKVFENLQTQNKTILEAINELNSNKVSYTKYAIINPAKGFSLTLDDASIYLVCYAGIDSDNIRNISFSVVVSRLLSSAKGGILDVKTDVPQTKLSLNENVLKITTTVWIRIYVIKL